MPWTKLEKPDRCPRCNRRREEIYSTPSQPDKPHPLCKVCVAEARVARRKAKATEPKPKAAKPEPKPAEEKVVLGTTPEATAKKSTRKTSAAKPRARKGAAA